MEQKQKKEFIRLRIKLAHDKLKAAKVLFKAEQYRDCVSRSYYAMYHMAKALLFSRGEDPYTHKGVSIFFNKLFIKTNIIGKEYNRLFARALQKREDCDYDITVKITKQDAKEAIENSEIFISKCEELLK